MNNDDDDGDSENDNSDYNNHIHTDIATIIVMMNDIAHHGDDHKQRGRMERADV